MEASWLSSTRTVSWFGVSVPSANTPQKPRTHSLLTYNHRHLLQAHVWSHSTLLSVSRLSSELSLCVCFYVGRELGARKFIFSVLVSTHVPRKEATQCTDTGQPRTSSTSHIVISTVLGRLSHETVKNLSLCVDDTCRDVEGIRIQFCLYARFQTLTNALPHRVRVCVCVAVTLATTLPQM